jgi:hypothetical protein
MSNTIISVYKNADNALGYEKEYIDPADFAEYAVDGWFRTQLEAISAAPVWTIDKATKAELAEYAKDKHGVDLDQTKKVADLREEVKALDDQ